MMTISPFEYWISLLTRMILTVVLLIEIKFILKDWFENSKYELVCTLKLFFPGILILFIFI